MRKRETERERDREKQRERERERERKRGYLLLKEMASALAPFTYLVIYTSPSSLMKRPNKLDRLSLTSFSPLIKHLWATLVGSDLTCKCKTRLKCF